MKKLEKLTLKELSNSVEVIDETNAAILVGGSDIHPPGFWEYYLEYGQHLPYGTQYDPYTDTCSAYSPPDPAMLYDYTTSTYYVQTVGCGAPMSQFNIGIYSADSERFQVNLIQLHGYDRISTWSVQINGVTVESGGSPGQDYGTQLNFDFENLNLESGTQIIFNILSWNNIGNSSYYSIP